MKKSKQLLLMIMMAVIFFAGTNAYSQDDEITFEVPYNIQNIHESTTAISIHCNTYEALMANGQAPAIAFGGGSAEIPFEQGTSSVEGTATVTARLAASRESNHFYRCGIYMFCNERRYYAGDGRRECSTWGEGNEGNAEAFQYGPLD
ncbi:hypothetical protein H8E50_04250 [bacterium]|nr:hypothetical protein [bacterium]